MNRCRLLSAFAALALAFAGSATARAQTATPAPAPAPSAMPDKMAAPAPDALSGRGPALQPSSMWAGRRCSSAWNRFPRGLERAARADRHDPGAGERAAGTHALAPLT